MNTVSVCHPLKIAGRAAFFTISPDYQQASSQRCNTSVKRIGSSSFIGRCGGREPVWKAHYLGGHRKRLAVPVASENPFQSEIPDKEGEFTRVSFPLRCLRQVELNDMGLLARQIAG